MRGYSKFSILKTSHCWVTPMTFWTLIRLKNTILSLEHLESALGENLVKFLFSVQKIQIFVCLPTQLLCKELFWGPVPCLCLPWRSVPCSEPLLLPRGQYMRIPFFPVLPEVLGLYFCVPSCVSGATEYLIRSTVIHV